MMDASGFSNEDFYRLRHAIILIEKDADTWDDVTDSLTMRVQDVPSNFERYFMWQHGDEETSLWLRNTEDGDFVILCRANGDMNVVKWSDSYSEKARKIWDALYKWAD